MLRRYAPSWIRGSWALAAVAILATIPREAAADEPAPSGPRERSFVLPAVLAGTGALAAIGGVILVTAAPDVPSTCNADTKSCLRAPGESPEDFAKTQERAGEAHTLPIAGYLTLGLGGMLVTAGLLTWAFGADGRAVARAAPITPWAGPGAGGLRAVVRF